MTLCQTRSTLKPIQRHPGLLLGLRGLTVEAKHWAINASLNGTGAAPGMVKIYCPAFFTLFRDGSARSSFVPLLRYPPPAVVEQVVAKAFLAYDCNAEKLTAQGSGAPMRTEFSLIASHKEPLATLAEGIFDGSGPFSPFREYLNPTLTAEGAAPARLRDVLTLLSTATKVYSGVAYLCSHMLPMVIDMYTDEVCLLWQTADSLPNHWQTADILPNHWQTADSLPMTLCQTKKKQPFHRTSSVPGFASWPLWPSSCRRASH
jgi:hypothetical protein